MKFDNISPIHPNDHVAKAAVRFMQMVEIGTATDGTNLRTPEVLLPGRRPSPARQNDEDGVA